MKKRLINSILDMILKIKMALSDAKLKSLRKKLEKVNDKLLIDNLEMVYNTVGAIQFSVQLGNECNVIKLKSYLEEFDKSISELEDSVKLGREIVNQFEWRDKR